MRWVDVFLARFQGPEVDACRPSGPAASSNRGCKIQLCATRRDQRLEHGAEKYRIQVTSNVVPSSGCRQHWEALLTSEKFLPFCVILGGCGLCGRLLARFQGPEVDYCRPPGPAASSNRGCRIQLVATHATIIYAKAGLSTHVAA